MDLHMPNNEIIIPLGLFILLVTLCFLIYPLFSLMVTVIIHKQKLGNSSIKLTYTTKEVCHSESTLMYKIKTHNISSLGN